MGLACRRKVTGLITALTLGSLAQSAHAQAGASDKAAAEALFDSALKNMKEGHYVDACPKLEESQRVDPGVGTLLYLAECYEKTGRTASAWATFREAASTARARGENDRSKVATERADRLEPSLSKLEVDVAAETRALPGLAVVRNGRPLTPSLFGVPFPVDPGKFQLTVNAPGYRSFSLEGEVPADGSAKRVKIPKLEAATPEEQMPKQDATTAVTPPPQGSASAEPAPDAQRPSANNGMRSAGLITGALGVVGLGIGSYFGVRAIAKNSDAEKFCTRGTLCDAPQGVSLTHDAQNFARLSNVTFAAGGALVIGGLIMYLASGSSNEAAGKTSPLIAHAEVDNHGASLSLGGRFE
jgi:serine/threonine-protein kinase